MLDNAVTYFHHLLAQGKLPSEAVEHVEQRYGIRREVVLARVHGKVANPEATRVALAEAKALIDTGEDRWSDAQMLLLNLYNAVTGEEASWR